MRRSVLTTRPDADARDAAHTMLTTGWAPCRSWTTSGAWWAS